MSVMSTDIKKYQITITFNAYEGTEDSIIASINNGIAFEEGECIIDYSIKEVEEESYVRDLSDNSVSGIYIETPRDYCLECGSDYKLLTHDYYGCPCCDAR
tara:strand:+ start:410 stop:712 length:303 start_codon:yes stop_codon:yes gene_type:complete